LVAHELAVAGYTSIRADKRSIGESEQAVVDEANLHFDTYGKLLLKLASPLLSAITSFFDKQALPIILY